MAGIVRFHWRYFLVFVLTFIAEVLIAVYMHDRLIRPYGGDVLVVILIYAFLMSFLRLRRLPTLMGVWLLSFVVEFSQYFGLIRVLHLQDKLWARLVLGTSYHWHDLLAYSLGILVVYGVERAARSHVPVRN